MGGGSLGGGGGVMGEIIGVPSGGGYLILLFFRRAFGRGGFAFAEGETLANAAKYKLIRVKLCSIISTH